MGLFGRLRVRNKAREVAKRRNSVYDPYESVQSNDNPYLTPYATGFVYKSFEFAMMSTWMMVNDYDEYLPDTIENIVLGIDAKMADSEALLDSVRGYIFELTRIAAASLDVETDPYTLPIMTSEENRIETESWSYSARAFIAAVLEHDIDGAMTIADTVCNSDPDMDESDIVPMYLQFITTVLILVTREWAEQSFPEFNQVEVGENDDNE